MPVKSKYVKHVHISEAKFRQIILLFSGDLSATQISHLTKISKSTVNKYLTTVRLRILEFSLLQSDPLVGQIEVDESYFGARRVRGKRGRGDRGINENTNGLIRQYFPKGTDFNKVTDSQIEFVMERLNTRPRKTRGGKQPVELFLGKAVDLLTA